MVICNNEYVITANVTMRDKNNNSVKIENLIRHKNSQCNNVM